MNGSRIFKGGNIMRHAHKMKYLMGIALAAAIVLPGAAVFAQGDSNNAPNPYRLDEGWGKTAVGRNFGSSIGPTPAAGGQNILGFPPPRGQGLPQSQIAPLPKI